MTRYSVFGSVASESAEETLARYTQRTSTQPSARSFVKDKVHGIKEATALLARNVKFRKERQLGTIETEWHEMRGVLQDQVQSLVREMQGGDKWRTAEALGDVMYTMSAVDKGRKGESAEVASVLSM